MAAWGQTGWANQKDPELDALFAELKADISEAEAARIERRIWEIWMDTGDQHLDRVLEAGGTAMSSGDYLEAMAAFNMVIETAPDFAEGWNKRATLHWLMGNYDASTQDIDQTLKLEPRHFGALSGLSMIHMAQNRPADALEALEKATHIHPHIPNAEIRLEQLKRHLGAPI